MADRWICDSCGQVIEGVNDGYVEWTTSYDLDRRPHGRGLRLVHAGAASPLGLGRCQYDKQALHAEGSGLSDLPLSQFVGPDGLMRLLSFIAHDDLPTAEVVLMIQRLHVPNYEEALPFMDEAVNSGVINPRMADGLYFQGQLEDIVRWAARRNA